MQHCKWKHNVILEVCNCQNMMCIFLVHLNKFYIFHHKFYTLLLNLKLILLNTNHQHILNIDFYQDNKRNHQHISHIFLPEDKIHVDMKNKPKVNHKCKKYNLSQLLNIRNIGFSKLQIPKDKLNMIWLSYKHWCQIHKQMLLGLVLYLKNKWDILLDQYHRM